MTYTLLSLLWIAATVPYMIFAVIRLSTELDEMQQGGYSNEVYLGRLREKGRANYCDLLGLLAAVPLLFFDTLVGELVAVLLWVMAYVLFLRDGEKHRSRHSLVFTDRATRLYVVTLAVFFVPAIVLLFLGVANMGAPSVARGLCLGIIALLPFLAPLVLYLANLLAQPFEERRREAYCGEAGGILASREDLLKVAITGSYGKTTLKQVLNRMLEEKYYTLMPSGSFGNAIAISSVVCDQLKPLHEALVVEMGAREVGDIRELCELVAPKYGILTALSNAHPESFASFDEVVDAKFELMEALPADGIAVVDFDNAAIRANVGRIKAKVITYGLYGSDLDYRGENIRYTGRGSEFVLRTADGAAVELRTPLLGEYNVRHIVGAAAMAHALGLSLKQIKRAVSGLAPMAHRMEGTTDALGIHRIDDTACTNLAAAEDALKVLREIEGSRRFLVLSGLCASEEENKSFGAKAAASVDYMILIDSDACPALREGILAAGFPADCLASVEDPAKAAAVIDAQAKKGDFVLYEGDLSATLTNREA